jgi:hypothetical protein
MLFLDAAATWSAGDLYFALQPYILAAFGALMTAFLAWVSLLLKKWFGLTEDKATNDVIQQAALNAAGRILASQDDRFAAMKVSINSPLIAQEIPIVEAAIKATMDKAGVTPDKLAALIQAKIGQLQAQAQNVPPVVATEPPKAAQ